MNAPPTDSGGVWFSTRDLYELIRGTNERLAEVAAELSRVVTLLEDTREEHADHEKRLRAVERWKYGVPLSAVMGLLSVIASVVIGLSRSTGKS